MTQVVKIQDTLSDDAMVNATQGSFLILSRYANSHGEYKIYGSVSLQMLNLLVKNNKDKGLDILKDKIAEKSHNFSHVSVGDISDICVNIFDMGLMEYFYQDSALFAFETKDGEIILQHST